MHMLWVFQYLLLGQLLVDKDFDLRLTVLNAILVASVIFLCQIS